MRYGSITFLRAICLLWFGAALSVHAQVLQVARMPISLLADVSERVMREASRRTGIRMEFQGMPLQRALPMANSGEVDAALMRTKFIDEAFPNLVRLRVPIMMMDYAAYVREPPMLAMSRDELRGMSLGVPKGLVAVQKMVEGLKVSEGPSFAATLEMLNAGRFDVAVMPHVNAEIEIKQNNWPRVLLWGKYSGSEPNYFVLNTKHQALVAPLEKALAQMEREGLIRKYYAEMLKAQLIEQLKN